MLIFQFHFRNNNDKILSLSLFYRNTIIVVDRKAVINVKAHISDNLYDGETTGDIEVNVARHVFAGKGRAVLHARQGDSEGDFTLELSHTGPSGTPHSVRLESTVKNYDPQFLTLVSQGQIVVDLGHNNNVKTVYGVTHKVEGGGRTLGGEVS